MQLLLLLKKSTFILPWFVHLAFIPVKYLDFLAMHFSLQPSTLDLILPIFPLRLRCPLASHFLHVSNHELYP